MKKEHQALGRDAVARLQAVERQIGVEFNKPLLLVEALTHPSYPNECETHPTEHNERLEFLGDAVIEIIVTEHLYRTFPLASEGELTAYRVALVCAETLGAIAQEMGLSSAMFFSRGERQESTPGTRSLKYICADVFEAVVGAIYLDQGMGACRMFLDQFVLSRMTTIVASRDDHKSKFQEMVQARFRVTPEYRVLRESGPDHERIYTVGCYVGTCFVAEAEGESKKEAKVAAAKLARETISQWEGRIAETSQKGSVVRHSGRNGVGT